VEPAGDADIEKLSAIPTVVKTTGSIFESALHYAPGYLTKTISGQYLKPATCLETEISLRYITMSDSCASTTVSRYDWRDVFGMTPRECHIHLHKGVQVGSFEGLQCLIQGLGLKEPLCC
jgi:hypothetical protein